MAFKVAARTVLELGAELISSDAVAIYELVKNSIDAGSPNGVAIDFCITLRHGDYVDALARAEELMGQWQDRRQREALASTLAELKIFIESRVVTEAASEARQSVIQAIQAAETPQDLYDNLRTAYVAHNWIEFRDSGCGMSREDLLNAYLVIGTPSRRRNLDATLAAGTGKPQYLGEKGVGRLSAMRLGTFLHVQTATGDDRHFNVLEVDWSEFEDLDKLVEDIVLEPKRGRTKPSSDWSGTIIRISGLSANWSPKRIQDVSIFELARLSDPFSKRKRRFRVAISFNGTRVDIPRLDHAILELAHARASGRYSIVNGRAQLDVELWCGNLGKGNAPEEKRIHLEKIDLQSITKDSDTEIPSSALRTVGPFGFELYWYNRRLLKGVDSIGERKRVQALQSQWAGIMLFRDDYRVFPYGDDDDDWLGLDRKALASQGYKLNKAQFIGRVAISRTFNRHLVDQTNREGLKDCDEKTVLVEVMRFVIQNRLHDFIDEVEQKQRDVHLDFEQVDKRVQDLDARAQVSLRALEKRHADEKPQLRELQALFDEMKDYFAAAKQRAEQIEDERDRMIQLAGVGLMLEIVAHELARSTEFTLTVLDDASSKALPANVASLFGTLREEIKTMNKRLRVLDPLSVSGRQRKESFDMIELVEEIFSGHSAQFKRHHVRSAVVTANGQKKISVYGVRGMFVQIVENLIQNSIYWMDLRRLDEEDYHPKINVIIDDLPRLLEYTDNGPGIQPSLADEVFKAFFSTKGKSRRQGLGLYIARDCASHHGGQLYLSDERKVHKERLNTFVLEIPKG